MLNKNTLGVKKVRGQAEAALQMDIYATKIFDITWGQEIIYQKSYLNDIHSLQGIFTTMIDFVTWPPLLYHIII